MGNCSNCDCNYGDKNTELDDNVFNTFPYHWFIERRWL